MENRLSPKIIKAMQIVVEMLKSTNMKWVLVGSMSLAVQGVKVEPRDIDILTDREGAYEIAGLLNKHETKPMKFRSTKWLRSYLGEFEIHGVKIEVMGDLEERIDNGWVSFSDRLVSPKLIKVDRMMLPVSSLEEQLKSYSLSNRMQNKIRSQKIREALGIRS